MDRFTEGYATCAFWSSTDEEGNPLDGIEADPSPTLMGKFEADCTDFQHNHRDLLAKAYEQDKVPYDEARAGHDFWLTRNGHGAGFWDRGLGEIGNKLSEAARACGNCELYVGDDGLIHEA